MRNSREQDCSVNIRGFVRSTIANIGARDRIRSNTVDCWKEPRTGEMFIARERFPSGLSCELNKLYGNER